MIVMIVARANLVNAVALIASLVTLAIFAEMSPIMFENFTGGFFISAFSPFSCTCSILVLFALSVLIRLFVGSSKRRTKSHYQENPIGNGNHWSTYEDN